MKREFPPVYTALVLGLVCVIYRLLSSKYPHLLPNISPLMAVSLIGAMYLPPRWGWLLGPSTLVLTDLAFTRLNVTAGMAMFSGWTLVSLAVYAVAGGLGIVIAKDKSLAKVLGGSVACSLGFYLVANTYAWAGGAASSTSPGYAPTLSGWWQANTVGLPGWEPTWHFLRNGMAGDLFFAIVLLFALDRAFLFRSISAKAAPRMA